VLVFFVGVLAAAFLAVGFVVQQHAAAEAPIEHVLSPRILLDLMRRPLWLAGIAAMVVGQLLGGLALRYGDLTVVEPLLATNILFALPLAARWSHERVTWREYVGAVVLATGLSGFLFAASPHGDGNLQVGWLQWAIAIGAIVGVAAAFTVVGKRLGNAPEATMLAAGGGCLYGLQDALTRKTLNITSVPTLFTSWALWLLVAVAATGIFLAQSAFRTAPLHASLPALTIAEPLTGIAFGAGVYGEAVRLTGWPLPVEAVSLALMVAGVLMVARSPVVVSIANTEEPYASDGKTKERAKAGSRSG
jgi:drug/metabolite transporter (DMT)-like permease